jgi:hypothetical protein
MIHYVEKAYLFVHFLSKLQKPSFYKKQVVGGMYVPYHRIIT